MKIKAFVLLIGLVLLMNVANLAFANEWTYSGRYVLHNNFSHNHHTDLLIVNHLISQNDQLVNKSGNKYSLYDVYFKHDHADDTGDSGKEYDNRSFRFKAMIVPLNNYGKPMDYKGAYSGTVLSEYVIASKGVFGVIPKIHKVYDRITSQVVFEAIGEMGSEPLYKNSAAKAMLKQSGDHPVFHGTADELNGSAYYPYL